MTDSATDHSATARLNEALNNPDPSARLRAVLAAGTRPDPEYAEILVSRCAVEPDFYVRDMLTWSLTRHPDAVVVPLLVGELRAGAAQARSQALHTLSKIGDSRAWPAITDDLLQDADDDVARSAWRAGVALVPEPAKSDLAATLATQLGRGGRDTRLSLSRAIAGLGTAADSALDKATRHGNAEARTHAIATQRLAENPDESYDESVFEARRALALIDAPLSDAPLDSPSSGVPAEGPAC